MYGEPLIEKFHKTYPDGYIPDLETQDKLLLEMLKEAQNEIKEIMEKLEKNETDLESSADEYVRMIQLNQHIQDIFKKKAKEINQKVKEQQSKNSKASPEEPLPLNDPFAGDASLAGMGSSNIAGRSQDDDNEMSLYNFKLVAIMTGEYVSYVSLINAAGEIVTLEMHEELSEGVKLVSLKPSEAVFQKSDETFLVINFKNQIKEVKELN